MQQRDIKPFTHLDKVAVLKPDDAMNSTSNSKAQVKKFRVEEVEKTLQIDIIHNKFCVGSVKQDKVESWAEWVQAELLQSCDIDDFASLRLNTL